MCCRGLFEALPSKPWLGLAVAGLVVTCLAGKPLPVVWGRWLGLPWGTVAELRGGRIRGWLASEVVLACGRGVTWFGGCHWFSVVI